MLAEIITIGDEILIGQIVDTNSAWIAKEFNTLGIKIRQITSVSDTAEQIKDAVNKAMKANDIILITGGLGPTKDVDHSLPLTLLRSHHLDCLQSHPNI